MSEERGSGEPRDPKDRDAIGEDELVPEDDRVIGRAFRISLGVIAVLVVGIGGTLAYLNRPRSAPKVVDRKATAVVEHHVDANPPAVRWAELGPESGVRFVHANGAEGEKLLPETMGGGCAFLDYDSDGDPDLLFVNGTSWPWAKRPSSAHHALYRNDGHGQFQDVTAAAGLMASFYGMGVAAGDYDNDGDPDLFFTAVGTNHLYRNDGGRFTDVTSAAGVAGERTQWSSGASFFDADNDGDLDLYVCNYVTWSPEIDKKVDFKLLGLGRAYGPPTNFEGSFPWFYRNDGHGGFREESATAGFRVVNPATQRPMAKALAVLPLDFDHDGWMDLLVANDTVQKFLFRNLGDGKFEEIGSRAGVAFDSDGRATGSMGVDAACYRNDAALAVAVGNFANEMTSFYVSQDAPGLFADEAVIEGIGPASRLRLTFGLFFFDYDLDGRLDLLQANGHIEDEIQKVQASQHYAQAAQLFWNRGSGRGGTFAPVDEPALGDLARPIVGRGASYADLDGDGDLDVVLTQVAGPPLLVRNEQALGHHWLRVRLVGKTSNRDAIGAQVELVAGGQTQMRMVSPTKSYLSQVELPVTFGLGDQTTVNSLRVTWPGGGQQTVSVDGVDREITIEQAS